MIHKISGVQYDDRARCLGCTHQAVSYEHGHLRAKVREEGLNPGLNIGKVLDALAEVEGIGDWGVEGVYFRSEEVCVMPERFDA